MLRKEYVDCIAIRKKLEENVTGSIFTSLNGDDLIVHINAGKGIRYKYEYRKVSYEKIGRELNYEKIARIIIKDYEEFILSKFFRR